MLLVTFLYKHRVPAVNFEKKETFIPFCVVKTLHAIYDLKRFCITTILLRAVRKNKLVQHEENWHHFLFITVFCSFHLMCMSHILSDQIRPQD